MEKEQKNMKECKEEKEEIFRINMENMESYGITKSGKIWSHKVRRFLKTKIHKGYEMVNINKTSYYIHRLLCLTFIPQPEGKDIVNHINSIKTDNRLENLEWCTQKENVNKSTLPTTHPRRILKIDKETGEVLGVFESIIEASKDINKTPGAISKVCTGKNKTAGGFAWAYEDEKYNQIKNIDLTEAKRIYDYKNYYIFPDGRIFSTKRKLFLTHTGDNGLYVSLSRPEGIQNCYIKDLLEDHFPEKYPRPVNKNVYKEKRKNKKKNPTNYNVNESFGTKSVEKSSDGSS
jgi:hypothetical protein